jgi:hypothetical protein
MGVKIGLFRRNDERRIANDQIELAPMHRLKEITLETFYIGYAVQLRVELGHPQCAGI